MAKSIIGTFEETVQKRASSPAARFREGAGDRWVTKTWAEMDKERKALAAGLLQLGLQANERVNVLAATSYRWMLADLAIQSAAGECVAIYQSNLPHECEYIINDCGAVMVFVENEDQLKKLVEEKAKLTRIRKVIVMDDVAQAGDWTIKFSDVVRMGEEKLIELEGQLKERTARVTPDDVLTIIYTSGTTGMPKGVVLTHGALLYEIESVRRINLLGTDDVELLFLPLAHSFAKILQCAWLGFGHEMAIDSDIQRITQNMAIVRPTVMAAVPRIFEKVYAKVVAGGLDKPGLAGKLFKWALGLNDQFAQLKIDQKPIPFGLDLQLSIARALVFSKVGEKLRETFGGRLKYFISGGAPLPKKMAYFFDNAGILILEGYGLTETSAATTVNRPDRNKIGTVGPPMPGTELKIAQDGEILIRGPGVMREYWNRPDATKDVLAPDGWFATGDIGVIDQDGYLKITDRKKDIIVTAGGKNVAPQNIENLVKASSPLVSQVMIHGDKRNYLVALVTVDAENAKKFAKDKGLANGDYAAVARSQEIEREIGEVMKKVNAQLASYETIKKFRVLDRDFEVGQELTPTLKVKRKFCNEKYRQILDGFYAEKVE
jgi:long-chain acyl-CoA synthetase